jgi:hypothetical protein
MRAPSTLTPPTSSPMRESSNSLTSASSKLTGKASDNSSKPIEQTDPRFFDTRTVEVKEICGSRWTYCDSEISSLRDGVQALQSQTAQSKKSKDSADETTKMLSDIFDTHDTQNKAIERMRTDTTQWIRELEKTIMKQKQSIAMLKIGERRHQLAQEEMKRTMDARFEAMAKENKETLDSLKGAMDLMRETQELSRRSTALVRESRETSRRLNEQVQSLLQKAEVERPRRIKNEPNEF